MNTFQKFSLGVGSFAFVALLSVSTVFANTDSFNLGFWAQSGPNTGSVQLVWNDPAVVTNYNVAYGTTPGSYTYGATNIGNASSYLVQGLNPGTKYYFALSPIVNGQGLGFTPETTAVATVNGTGANQGPVSQAQFNAPVGGPTSDQYRLRATPGPNPGQVSLTWDNPWNANDFDVVYGTQTGGFVYGAQNVGQNTNQYVVSGLTSGWSYAFAVLAENNGTMVPGSGLSAPVAQKAK